MIDSPHERLQLARHAAGFASATDAARELKFNENTYRSHENGERGIRLSVAKTYAAAFSISISWLLTGEGNPRGNKYVENAGSIANNGLVVHIPDQHNRDDPALKLARDLVNMIKIPFVPPDNCIAFYVIQNQRGRYSEGDVLLSWDRCVYNPKNMIDGVIWLSERDAALQIILQDIGRRPRLHHRFDPTKNLSTALFNPIQAVVTAGHGGLMDDDVAERWARRSV